MSFIITDCFGNNVFLYLGGSCCQFSAGLSQHACAAADIGWLTGRVFADHWFAATVLPQLHVLAWGNKRGV
jgi:hypothetical protein